MRIQYESIILLKEKICLLPHSKLFVTFADVFLGVLPPVHRTRRGEVLPSVLYQREADG